MQVIQPEHFLFHATYQVTEICRQPLLEKYGMNYFQYARVFQDGSIFNLTNTAEWLEYSWNKKRIGALSCVDKTIIDPFSYCFLWRGNLPDEPINLARNEFGYDHALCLLERHRTYYDMIAFAAPPENTDVYNIYLNQIDQLKNFAANFRDQAAALIKQAEQHRIILPNDMQDKNKDVLLPSSGNSDEYLSKREYDCMYLLAQGNTYKQIGRILDISSRTVETHIHRIKKRLNAHTRSDLVALLKKYQ